MFELSELKKANCFSDSVLELKKDILTFKEDIRKKIQNIYIDNTDIQATLRDDIESVTDDFSNLSENS